MKKLYFLFSLMAIALTSAAQSVGSHGELIGQYGAVYGMPEGAPTKTYKLMGVKAVYDNGDPEQGTEPGVYTLDVVRDIEVVEFPDGTMFFKDLVTDAAYGSYVKGTRVKDDDDSESITIPIGQVLAHNKDYDCNIVMMRFLFSEFDGAFDIVNCTDPLVFNVEKHGDSEILTQMSDQIFTNFYGAMLNNEKQQIAAIGDAAVTMTYAPAESEFDSPLSMPAGVPAYTYSCHAYSYAQSAIAGDDKYVTFNVEMAQVGNEVYIKGLYFYENPDALNPISNVVKGTWSGSTITFPQHQFIGVDGRGANIYAVAMGTDRSGNYFEARDNWTLTFDPATGTYNGNETILRFNPNPFYKPGVAAYESIDEIVLTPVNVPAGIINVNGRECDNQYFDLQGRAYVGEPKSGIAIQGGKLVLKK